MSLLAFALAAGVTAQASAQSAISGEFSVQRFDPAPGPRNLLSTRGGRVGDGMTYSFGLIANYSRNPFVVASCESQTDCSSPNAVQSNDIHVVENLATADLLGSFNPINRLQLGLRVPVTFVEGDGITDQGTPDYGHGIKTMALGDVELEGKVRLYGEVRDPFVVAAALYGTAPLGKATAKGSYVGNDTPTVGLRGIFDGEHGPLAVGGNLSYTFRGEGHVGNTDVGKEFGYSAGVGYFLSPIFRVVADGFGTTRFSSQNGTNTLEVDGAMQVFPTNSRVGITAGGGVGIVQGVGVPDFRAIVGFNYVVESTDRDHDGILDEADQCPTVPEDRDGFEDADGCPDPDNDGDAIPDTLDKCPNQPEDMDGFQDADGCPDPDNDKDGIPDVSDRCPNEPETKNGYKDDDGCPDVPDSDGDGVPDSEDKCPNEPEDTDGFQDTDGCPDPDNDGDGIPDVDDECVDQPETKNGFQDADGCPDVAPAKNHAAPAKKTAPPKSK